MSNTQLSIWAVYPAPTTTKDIHRATTAGSTIRRRAKRNTNAKCIRMQVMHTHGSWHTHLQTMVAGIGNKAALHLHAEDSDICTCIDTGYGNLKIAYRDDVV